MEPALELVENPPPPPRKLKKWWRNGKPRSSKGRPTNTHAKRSLAPLIATNAAEISRGSKLYLHVDLRRKEFRELYQTGWTRDRYGRLYNKAAGEKPTGPKVWDIRYKQVHPSEAKYTPEQRRARHQTNVRALHTAGKLRKPLEVQGPRAKLALMISRSMQTDIRALCAALGLMHSNQPNTGAFARRALSAYIDALHKHGVGPR